jgi:dihydrofolate reductase
MVSVFCGMSVDGFIARRNGSFDFLDAGGNVPHGYDEFIAGIDAILMGRNTFETVMNMGLEQWPYGKKRVVVLSHRSLDFSGSITKSAVAEGLLTQMSGEPAKIVAQLAATGSHNLYVDGGITVQEFLRAGAIDRIIVSRVPVLIGEGIPLFGTVPKDILLEHVATKQFKGGLVQSEYRVVKG